MAAIKPDKIREEMYDAVVAGLETQGFTPVGRSKEGLVYENTTDGEHVVVKVIKKKNMVDEDDIGGISTYAEKLAAYETEKAQKKAEEDEKAEKAA